MSYNQTVSIRRHYDVVSPHYRELWGPHLHHGLWKDGSETAAQAQEALVEELISRAALRPGMRILDVGCGFGGSSIYLATKLDAQVVGITISPVQVEMAQAAAAQAGANAVFHLMDAQAMKFPGGERYDCVWSIEAISHFADKDKFFADATRLLAPGGTIALIDWFRKAAVSATEETEYLEPIERGMLVDLRPVTDYATVLATLGNTVLETANLSDRVAKTWDLCLDIISDGNLSEIARALGDDFVHFLESFSAMKAGYQAGALEYQLLVARKS